MNHRGMIHYEMLDIELFPLCSILVEILWSFINVILTGLCCVALGARAGATRPARWPRRGRAAVCA